MPEALDKDNIDDGHWVNTLGSTVIGSTPGLTLPTRKKPGRARFLQGRCLTPATSATYPDALDHQNQVMITHVLGL
jgi:hypothetical protein